MTMPPAPISASMPIVAEYYRPARGRHPLAPGLLCRSGGGRREWLAGYVAAGASHLVLRFAGDHERHLDMLSALRARLGG